jgi:gas vesicle protein
MKTSLILAMAALAGALSLMTSAPAQETQSGGVKETVKEDAKTVGHAVEHSARTVGHAVADTSRQVGHEVAEKTEPAREAIKEDSRKAGHAIEHGARTVAEKTKAAVAPKSDDSKTGH